MLGKMVEIVCHGEPLDPDPRPVLRSANPINKKNGKKK
jgi:hypothetical protein